jgi:D-amino-acid dehydrogenase
MRAVVVGTGVLGASAAYHLARAGAQVVAIDAKRDGRATAAGAGIICPWVSGVDDPAFFRLYVEGARYYADLVPALAEQGETDLGYRRTGALLVSREPAELAFFERLLRERQASMPEMGAITRLKPRDARRLFPPLGADFGAVHVAAGARVSGRLLAAALLRAATRAGAVVRDGEAALTMRQDRIVGVTVKGEAIAADQVVLTAGVWAPRFCARWGSRCQSSRSVARSFICA